MSFTLGQSPGPEVKVLSKILPLAQHSVFDCIHILSWDPVHPVVRGFRGAQLKRLEGKKGNQAVLERSGGGAGSATHMGLGVRAEKEGTKGRGNTVHTGSILLDPAPPTEVVGELSIAEPKAVAPKLGCASEASRRLVSTD